MNGHKIFAACLTGLAVALTSCTGDDGQAGDLDAAAARLAEDGAAVVHAFTEPSVVETHSERLVYDSHLDERCGDEGMRRVWRTDLLLLLPAGDPTDVAAVNREFDNLHVTARAELEERGYASTVWSDSDTDAPDWSVFERSADDGAAMEIRTTFQLAPDQPDDAMAVQVDVIGTTSCVVP